MKQRIITAFFIMLVAIPPLFVGGIPLRLLIMGVVAISSYEILHIHQKNTNWFLVFFLFSSTIIMYLMPWRFYNAAIVAVLVCLFLISICTKEITIDDVCFVFVMMMILTLAGRGIEHIYSYGKMMMIYVVLACFGTDIGAYFIGVTFGKHKLIEHISPKKTWEGAIGGWFVGAVSSYVFGYYVYHGQYPTVFAIGSLLLPIVAQIGDLSFSAIKRQYGIKDFGTIFPGHGGVLDRIDSLLFCLMVFYSMLLVMEVLV